MEQEKNYDERKIRMLKKKWRIIKIMRIRGKRWECMYKWRIK